MFNKRLLALVPTAWRYIFAQVAFQWIALVANIALMISIGLFLQQLFTGALVSSSVLHISLVAAFAIAVRALCVVQAQSMSYQGSAAAKQAMRRAVFGKLTLLGPTYAEKISTSEAVQISVEGTEQLEVYFGSYLPQVLYAVLAPLTLFACLAPFSLQAAGVLLICVPLIPISIIFIQKLARKVMRTYWGAYADLGGMFLENMQGLTTLKIYGADAASHAKMNEEAEGFRRSTMKLLSMQLNSITVMDILAFGGAALGIIVVLFQFAEGSVSFAATFALVLLSAEFFLPMRTLGSFFHTAMNGIAAAEKMFHLLDADEPTFGSKSIDPNNVAVTCENVEYSYDGERSVLDRINFVAENQSFTAIVGESGSGKSTFASIIAGRCAGFSGSVCIGGIDVRDLSRDALTSSMTTVSFSSYLFKGSVRFNLLMAQPEASDEELWSVLHRCQLSAFVEAMGGLDFALTEQASNLSGGQRQRLSIARALLHDTPLYVFDEVTSNVDAESEAAIIALMSELAKAKTVIVISHRLAAIAGADRIYAMKDGRIAESGTKDELLRQEGIFSQLWNEQSGLEAYVSRQDEGQLPHRAESGEELELLSDGVVSVSPASFLPKESPLPLRCDNAKVFVGESVHAPVVAIPNAGPSSGGAKDPEIPSAFEGSQQKGRSNFAVMVGLIRLVGPLVPYVALAVALGVVGFLAAIFLTVFGAYGIASVMGQPWGVGLSLACLLIAFCGMVRGPLRYGEQLCNHYLAFKILARIRDKVFESLRLLAPAKLEGRDKGNLISLVTSDIELLEVFYAHTISPIIIATITSVVMVLFIGSFSLELALVALVAYVVVGVAVPYVASAAAGALGRTFRNQVGDMNSFVLDSLRGLLETLQYGRSDDRMKEMNSRSNGVAQVEAHMKRLTGRFSAITGALVLFFSLVMVGVASSLYAAGSLDISAVCIGTLALMSSFGPVVAVANLGSSLQLTLAAGSRVLDVLEETPQVEEVVQGDSLAFSGAQATDVGFSYGNEQILSEVNLAIQPGCVTCIAGRSGSGKSTFLKLLMRFWDVSEGSISISSKDIRQINTKSLRINQGYMTQDTHLFAGTIGENILLAKSDATREELDAACRRAALLDLIDRLPKGFNTPVGELGDTLSGGERQRVGLARLFLHDAPLMILDEPTSNLDSLNEAAVLKALESSRADKTIVLVSHRISTCRFADVVYEVGQGRVS